MSVQFEAWLRHGVWLRYADHANVLATRLGDGLMASGVDLVHPVEANMVFALLTPAQDLEARAADARFYTERPEERPQDSNLVEARLVTSWSTTMSEVDRLIDAIGSA